MNHMLVTDMYRLLEKQLSPEADIPVTFHNAQLEQLSATLQAYTLPYMRKVVILGCYHLLQLAVCRHQELYAVTDQSGSRSPHISKTVLDGDYLFGILFPFAIRMKERRLVAPLTHAYKKIQILLLHGSTLNEALSLLIEQTLNYVREEASRSKSGGDTDEVA